MMKLLSIVILVLGLCLGSVAAADPLQVSVSYSEKAEKKMTETYGVREKSVIFDLIDRNLKDKLGTRAARVEVVINDLTANRPTQKQMGDRPGLSMQSFGIGGADISGKAYDGAGNLIGQADHTWNGDIAWAQGSWTWSDTDRAISSFARKLAKAVPG
ncbi:hypothetical protein [Candidatus Phycosocius spiralis]|uniref:DUF4410 domain-containing protein n=1 Tax=Candidatus Phycosocius spiralis TaxID=2815099 RepID=A0ABQ4PV67_9PROT|nr:hypothetical protein [Candidatus Phycosocius spiralis]GIU66830.1 hypothetical protein PsB1_0984 [Candidatus Phycosocius spiralis]